MTWREIEAELVRFFAGWKGAEVRGEMGHKLLEAACPHHDDEDDCGRIRDRRAQAVSLTELARLLERGGA